MPHTKELARRYEDQGLVLIAIHTESSAEKMAPYVRAEDIDFPVALDAEGKTVEAFRVDSFPDYYLIDRAGVLRVADLQNDDVERAVKVLLAEKPPQPEKKAEEASAAKKAKDKRKKTDAGADPDPAARPTVRPTVRPTAPRHSGRL